MIGKAMRQECDERSPFRIYLHQAQTFWQSTGRGSLIVQPVRRFVCRPVLKSNCTPKAFAIRDFSSLGRMATSLLWKVVQIKSKSCAMPTATVSQTSPRHLHNETKTT